MAKASGGSASTGGHPPFGDLACPPGYRDDDWFMTVNLAPCSLNQPAKEALNAVLLGFAALALIEIVVSRFFARIDKTPVYVLISYIVNVVFLLCQMAYMVAYPYASATRQPDFSVLFVSMFLVGGASVLVSIAVANHFISLSRHILRTVINDAPVSAWSRLMTILQVVAFLWGIGSFVAQAILLVILPAVNFGDPDLQNIFLTAAYAIFAGFGAVYGIILMSMMIMTYRVVLRQVRAIQFGSNQSSTPSFDLSTARKIPGASRLVDVLYRLRFVQLVIIGNFSGQAVIMTMAAIFGQRWYINIISAYLILFAEWFVTIALFRPRLLPAFIGGHLGFLTGRNDSSGRLDSSSAIGSAGAGKDAPAIIRGSSASVPSGLVPGDSIFESPDHSSRANSSGFLIPAGVRTPAIDIMMLDVSHGLSAGMNTLSRKSLSAADHDQNEVSSA